MQTERKDLFEHLFKQHFYQLYVHAYGWVSDQEVAKDIVHDSFCYLWEHFELYDNKNLLALLYTFVRSRCSDYVRHQRVEENYIEYQLSFSEEELDDYSEYQERLTQVRKMIDKLPPQTKKVFVECVLNRKSYKETAELMQISPLTVKTLVSRAYKFIRSNCYFILFILYSVFFLITFY